MGKEFVPIPYYKARIFAKKNNLIMKVVLKEDRQDAKAVYFFMKESTAQFFIKSENGERQYLRFTEMLKYLRSYVDEFYIPAGRNK